MSKDTLNFLYECIEKEKDVIEFMKTFEFNCVMLDFKMVMEYTPLSFFEIGIKSPDKKHTLKIHFSFNARKKYLEKINFEYYGNYNIQVGYFENREVVSSGIIAPNFMLPLEAAMKIVIEN